MTRRQRRDVRTRVVLAGIQSAMLGLLLAVPIAHELWLTWRI